MRALVVYESLWGNTEKVARAIAAELELSMPVTLTDSDRAPDSLDGYDLIVVGGPTHAFSMSRAATRAGAVKENGAPHAPDRGIREWLSILQPGSSIVQAWTFDTRVDKPRLPGSAARSARHELRTLGFTVDAKPASFHVHGYSGPLVEGELEKAALWVRNLVKTISPTPHS